jgi:dihydrofolate synthase/folylpolyglutamate synthase
LPLADAVVCTRYVENPRSVPPEEIADAVRELGGPEPVMAADPAEALALAKRITPGDALVVVTGSLFLAAETRALILHRDDPTASPRAALI